MGYRTLLVLAPLLGPPLAAQTERPNVILIMTDDQGYGDLGATGNPVLQTPNIDAMARASATMSNFYVSPVCAPTRACLMTGRYNYRTRAIDTFIGRAMMEPAEVTIAEVLGDAGYATGIFGKWHLGDCPPMRPNDQGFEEALVHRGGGIGQPSDPPGGEGRYTDAVLFHNGTQVQTVGYCTDVYFDAAAQWIDKMHGEERNFFAYIPPNCPHGPFDDVPPAAYAAYRERDLGNDEFPQNRGHALPQQANLDRRARIFGMISNIDDNVGKLFATLDRLDLTDNTLVIFMVDNGPNGRRFVGGYRGQKSEVYEGGIRSPFFAHWPARFADPVSSDRVAAHIDVMPTILDACGVPRPENLDGRSLLPLLAGEADGWPQRTIYIQAHRGDQPVRYHNFAARSQRWKLLNASGFGREQPAGAPEFELYDLVVDPFELRDVAPQHADVVATMVANYDAWFEDVGSTRPDNYAPPRIHIGSGTVVLTRQDWRRRSTDGGWSRGSRGAWLLRVTAPGRYEMRLRFPPAVQAGRLILRVGGAEHTAALAAGAASHVFSGVDLRLGDTELEAEIRQGDSRRGPHQVEVRRTGT